jgi:FkbM family methyltransferase
VLVVGAHIGTVAIGLARHCRHVTAIEANPWTYKLLQCNILLNEVGNITSYNFAASDKSQKIRFVMNTHNTGGCKQYPVVPHEYFFYDQPKIVELQAHSLDQQLGKQQYALVLMDIEGSEYFALTGMTEILRSARTLIVEFLPLHLSHVAGVTPEEFAALLTPHFSSLSVDSLGLEVPASQFAATLRRMYDANHVDAGIIFSKGK